jgi:hypothetical protein
MAKVLKGANIMRISMPIVIFSNISQLQHVAKNKGFAI